jgi:hypothetical protein
VCCIFLKNYRSVCLLYLHIIERLLARPSAETPRWLWRRSHREGANAPSHAKNFLQTRICLCDAHPQLRIQGRRRAGKCIWRSTSHRSLIFEPPITASPDLMPAMTTTGKLETLFWPSRPRSCRVAAVSRRAFGCLVHYQPLRLELSSFLAFSVLGRISLLSPCIRHGF